MQCPRCHDEMKEGVVQSARSIFFTTKPHKFFFVPDGAVTDEVLLSHHNWTRPTCQAYHCARCRKIVIDYDDED